MERFAQNIYNDLLELSDLGFQKKLWLNENNDTGLISSYTELMNRLFDDDDFDDFIDNHVSKIGVDSNMISKLNLLRHSLNRYEEKETDKEIINDPKWAELSSQARLIIEMWNDHLSKNTDVSKT